MSYSFSVAADSKAEANKKIAETFDATVVSGQPSHEADRNAAVTAAQSFVQILADPPPDQEIYVSMCGSLGWKHDTPGHFLHASLSVNASIRDKSK